MYQAVPASHTTFSVGDLTVTQLSDGFVEHSPSQAFFGINARPADFEALSRAHHLSVKRFEFPATVTLVESRGERVLIDAGHGVTRKPTAGHMLEVLQQADVAPESIDHIIISHLHADHIGGLLSATGAPMFPQANHWVTADEVAYWLGPAPRNSMTARARLLVEALGSRLAFIKPGEELVPGVTIMDSSGHTPGHICVMLESQGDRVLVAGDLANHPVWAIMRPDWHMNLDIDPMAAAATRRRVLSMVADEQILFAGSHMPFPAIGKIVRADDQGFRYEPVDISAR